MEEGLEVRSHPRNSHQASTLALPAFPVPRPVWAMYQYLEREEEGGREEEGKERDKTYQRDLFLLSLPAPRKQRDREDVGLFGRLR